MPWFAYAHYPALEADKQTAKANEKSLSAARDTAEAGFAFLSEIVSKLLYNAARHEDASFPSHQAASWRQCNSLDVGAKEWLRLSLAI